MDTTPDRLAEPTPEAAPRPAPPRPEARQRWRLTFARAAPPGAEAAAGRDYSAVWERALAESGLPVATTDAGRVRFALAAPLPARTTGLAEVADLWLTERVAAWRVRETLHHVAPLDHHLVTVEDVWLGAPALASRVAAADYVVKLDEMADRNAIAGAADRLLAADRLIRERAKGGGVKTYDLRPLLISIEIDNGDRDGAEGVVVRLRTRIHPELGSGRPEEVIAALADQLGEPLQTVETIRERLVLGDDPKR